MCVISNFAKLYLYRHMVRCWGPNAIPHCICEQYPIAPTNSVWYGSRFGSFSKNRNFFMNLDRDKIHTKIVAFDEIYNFIVQTFFI
jgi:hypothetical protein